LRGGQCQFIAVYNGKEERADEKMVAFLATVHREVHQWRRGAWLLRS